MRLFSWNVYCYNKNITGILEFIRQSNFDIFALQEVSSELLKALKSQDWHVASAVDHQRISGSRSETCYLAILSKYPFKAQQSFLTRGAKQQAPRTKLFTKLMATFATGWVEKVENHHAHYVDIAIPGTNRVMRIFNAHLSNDGPTKRIEEFAQMQKHIRTSSSTIVCGDFNILQTPFAKLGNWLLGAPLKEGLPWHNERSTFEELFESLKLKNPLRGKRTYKSFHNQLDHILVPHNAEIIHSDVEPELAGSDHFPIRVEANLP